MSPHQEAEAGSVCARPNNVLMSLKIRIDAVSVWAWGSNERIYKTIENSADVSIHNLHVFKLKRLFFSARFSLQTIKTVQNDLQPCIFFTAQFCFHPVRIPKRYFLSLPLLQMKIFIYFIWQRWMIPHKSLFKHFWHKPIEMLCCFVHRHSADYWQTDEATFKQWLIR